VKDSILSSWVLVGSATTGALISGDTADGPANLVPGSGPLFYPDRPDAGWLGGVPANGWQIVRDPTALVSGGVWELPLSDAATDTSTIASVDFIVVAGQTVCGSAYLRKKGAWASGDIAGQVTWFAEVGQPPIPPQEIGTWTTGDGETQLVSFESATVPAGAIAARVFVNVSNARAIAGQTASAQTWKWMVHYGDKLRSWNDGATAAYLIDVEAGKNVVVDGAVVPKQDLLNSLKVTIKGPDRAEIFADFQGNIVGAPYPIVGAFRLLRGTEDVGRLASWTNEVTGCTGAPLSSEAPEVYAIAAMTAPTATVRRTATFEGVEYPAEWSVKVRNGLPPSPGGASAQIAYDDTVEATASATFEVVAGPLTVAGGAGGIEVSAPLEYTAPVNQALSAELQVEWRAIGGSWAAWGSPTASVQEAVGFVPRNTATLEPASEPVPGYVPLRETITGLTSGTPYEVRLSARWASRANSALDSTITFTTGSFSARTV
jgi:hypothetical protein